MGKQSARLYYKGKDHKDIYYKGHYHVKMYKGDQLIWEKIKQSEWKKIDRDLLITFLMTYFKTSTYTKPTMVIGYGGAVEFSFKMKGAQDSELRYYDQTIRVKYKKSLNRFVGSGVRGQKTLPDSSEIIGSAYIKNWRKKEKQSTYTEPTDSSDIVCEEISRKEIVKTYFDNIMLVRHNGLYGIDGRYNKSIIPCLFDNIDMAFEVGNENVCRIIFLAKSSKNILLISYDGENIKTENIADKFCKIWKNNVNSPKRFLVFR